jgi:hypothetical protein
MELYNYTGAEDRQYFIKTLDKIARPVLEALSKGRLHATMPVEQRAGCHCESSTHLEAFARTLTGIAPWLRLGSDNTPEGALRSEYIEMALAAIDAATDPASPDYMNYTVGAQPIVDAAFLAHALLRAPDVLLDPLPTRVKENLTRAFMLTREGRKPYFCNWLLFSAMIEAVLHRMEKQWDRMRVDYALRQHEAWYVGDGAYSDGPDFHFDFYNSFVIQPMLLDILAELGDEYGEWAAMRSPALKRAKRYGAVLERMIAPDGSFPPLGRSIAYRCGAFHLLAQLALSHNLPDCIKPAQVRCALAAVMRRTLTDDSFTPDGWLCIGLCAHQPSLGESYISTGSLYLASVALLPLGLPDSDPFWRNPPELWTQARVWSGIDCTADKSI